MRRSHVTAGRPLAGPDRAPATRGFMKWKPPKPSRAAKKVTLSPAENVGGKSARLGLKAQAEPQPIGYIAAEALSFLSVRNFFILGALTFISVLLVLGLVRANHQAVVYSYEISALTQTRLDALEKNRKLKMELAQLTSLDQLERAARNNLELGPPQKGRIVVID